MNFSGENDERIKCLVEQGFTPGKLWYRCDASICSQPSVYLTLSFLRIALAQSVILARSREYLPLTIWLVDNSSSMTISDGKRLIETSSQSDVRLERCTRWEELQETVRYHAQLAALLEAPTRFVLLNTPTGSLSYLPQEMSIAERGNDWIATDLDTVLSHFSRLSPQGVTPLTSHLNRIYQSIQYVKEKIVLVLATDGRPTDSLGYFSAAVDRAFENALRQIQSHAWVVVRLCTSDNGVLEYYRKLDEQMELSLEVLDDYLDEATEVHQYNPWLTYSLVLHRCREMGLSCHALHRWLDWLDERTMTRIEIQHVLDMLGFVEYTKAPHSLDDQAEWGRFCTSVDQEQKRLMAQRNEGSRSWSQAFSPWNPIRRRSTPWIDIKVLRRQGSVRWRIGWTALGVFVVIIAMLAKALY